MVVAWIGFSVSRFRAAVFLTVLLSGFGSAVSDAQVILGASDSAEIRGTTTAIGGSTVLPGVLVTCTDPTGRVTGSSVSDGEGRFRLPDLPMGVCRLKATLDGFRDIVDTVTLTSRQVLERKLDFEIAGVTETVRVVSGTAGDMATVMAGTLGLREGLGGTMLEQLPLSDGSIQAALNILPGVVQGRDGLSIRGGFPTQSSVQVGAASLIEPASGETVIWLPADAVASVDVLPNPYAAEYGRFSSGVTVMQTRQGSSVWRAVFQDFDPTLRRQRDGFGVRGVQAVSPRLFVGGPLVKDRVFLAQSVFYRYESRDILSRPQTERSTQHTASLFTRVDAALGARGSVAWTVGAFPQRRDAINLDTFTPPDVATNWRQRAYTAGASHNVALTSSSLLESAVHVNRYQIGIDGAGNRNMVIAPDLNEGNYFNTQDRKTTTIQWLESAAGQRRGPLGLHVFKAGFDVQHAVYTGTSRSRQVDVRRVDGTLAQTIVFGAPAVADARNTDFGAFLQDRWQPTSRVALELGIRYDRDGALGRNNVAPRAGGLVLLNASGSMAVRAGIGTFYERTPTAAATFGSSETRVVSRYGGDGVTLAGTPVRYLPWATSDLETARGHVWNVEYDYRVSPQLSVRASVLDRQGSRGLVVAPVTLDSTPGATVGNGVIQLDSQGRSRYREAGIAFTYTPAAGRELSVSYLRSSSEANLNAFTVTSGFFPDPFVRPDEYGPIGTNVPNRLVARVSGGVGENVRLFAAIEARSGLPYTALDDQQDVVGRRNRDHAFPTVARVDLAVERRFTFGKWHPWVGVRVWNALNEFLPQDVQRNVGSPAFGAFYNRSPRVIRITFRLER